MRQLGRRLGFAITSAFLATIAATLVRAVPTQVEARTPGSQAAPQGSNQASNAVTCTVEVSPKTYSAPIAEALQLYRTGKLDAAAAAYNAIISAGGPDLLLAYIGLSRVYLRQEKVNEAFAVASSAVALTPGKTPAITALGEVYFRQGKMRLAEDSFLNPQKVCDIDARSYLGLAKIYRATSNYKREKRAIGQAYKLDPDDPDIKRVYMDTLSHAERIKFLQDYLSRETNDDVEDRAGLVRELAVLQDQVQGTGRGCRITSKLTDTETPLEPLLEDPKHIRGYGLKIKVNGVPAKLLLDTGAGGILIDKRTAEKAGVKKVADAAAGGIGDKGFASGYIGFANFIQVGDLQFEGCYIQVLNRRSVLGDDGLIGADVFESYLVDIDFPDAKFKLSALPPYPDASPKDAVSQASLASNPEQGDNVRDRYVAPEMKKYTPVFRFYHMLLIPTSVNNSPATLFAMDTGAFANTITPEAAKQVTKLNRDEDLRVEGINGEVKNVYTSTVSLKFAYFKRDREELTTFSLDSTSKAIGTEVSGLLGFVMLYMLDIKIDYRDGLVNFTYVPLGAKPKPVPN
ncbi:MAG TPA: aspartyl protease family protein [Candidatus Binatus sp.]|jgi:tetratricopeptide (TPR) repeat protein|nr:aspartyl protease family protein [Candidatus Binatus sp.]